jgi:hypothetical protein
MPATALRKVQLGKEATWGTATAATAVLMGATDAELSIDDEVQVIEQVGSLGPSGLVAEVSQSGSGSIKATATYEDILYFLHGIFGAGTKTGTTAPYSWAYAAPLSSAPTPQVYTIEYGTAGALYKLAGALFSKMTISGEAGKTWEISTDVLGKQVSTLSSLASLSDRAVTLVNMADTVLAVDTTGGTAGATTVDATLIKFDLEVDTKRHLKQFAGNVLPTAYGEDRWTGSLKLTLEFNAASKAYVDALLAPGVVQKLIEIKGTKGSQSVAIDFCGVLAKGTKLFGDRNGNMTVELTFDPLNTGTLADWLKVTVANTVASLT